MEAHTGFEALYCVKKLDTGKYKNRKIISVINETVMQLKRNYKSFDKLRRPHI